MDKVSVPDAVGIVKAWIDQIGEELLPVQERGKA
jgi:hypothetical protein